jgi:hypothetical protein
MCAATALAQDRPLPVPTAHDPHESRSTRGDGIKVHGHWAIDVRNPDGTLASHNEFENAFSGARALSGVLVRAIQITGWTVQLASVVNGTFTGPCRYQNASAVCHIVTGGDPINPVFIEQVYNNLVVTTPQDAAGTPLGTVQLAGHFTASYPIAIQTVDVQVFTLDVTSNSTGLDSFSGRALDPNFIQVAAGQEVYVTVTYSFSS